jgi:1-aminocyclopropane-1-carboxylate deaminase
MSSPVPLQPLDTPLFRSKGLTVKALRLDTLHTVVSGNKVYKLKYNLEAFRSGNHSVLVTMGGAFSNHLAATAYACAREGIPCIGVVRGDELHPGANPRLEFMAACGMQLLFVTRSDFADLRRKQTESRWQDVVPALSGRIPEQAWFLPEGGANEDAVRGCREIMEAVPADTGYVCTACGTGATLAGIVSAPGRTVTGVGITVLSGMSFLETAIRRWSGTDRFRLFDYSFGRYARRHDDLDAFCERFSPEQQLPLEPVYSGRLFYALEDLARKDFFPPGAVVVGLHNGGIFAAHAASLLKHEPYL